MRIPSMPESGGAATLRPGTNLATTSDFAPCRENKFSVFRTHESGSSEIRHIQLSTRDPLYRPNSYQVVSASKEPRMGTTMTPARPRFPDPASAPAASNAGTDEIGKPNCSEKTQTPRTVYP